MPLQLAATANRESQSDLLDPSVPSLLLPSCCRAANHTVIHSARMAQETRKASSLCPREVTVSVRGVKLNLLTKTPYIGQRNTHTHEIMTLLTLSAWPANLCARYQQAYTDKHIAWFRPSPGSHATGNHRALDQSVGFAS